MNSAHIQKRYYLIRRCNNDFYELFLKADVDKVKKMGIEIKDFNGEGYSPVISYHNWRVAIVNYCERLREDCVCKVERHTKTDEVFILLQGKATLHIGKELKKFPMQQGKFYNVKCGEWHAITMTSGSKVVVVEDDDTNQTNTEYYYF